MNCDGPATLPLPPRLFIDPKLPRGLGDRPAHHPTLREHPLGEGLGFRKRVISEEGQDSGHGRNGRLGLSFLPVDDGELGDAETRCDLLLREAECPSLPSDMLP